MLVQGIAERRSVSAASSQQLTRMEIGYCLDGSSHKQSSAVLVRYGKALSPAIADCLGCQTDQQLTRMGIVVRRN